MEELKEIIALINTSGIVGLFIILGFVLWKGGILSLWKARIETDKEFVELAKTFVEETKELKESVEYCRRTQEILEKLETGHANTDHNGLPRA